MHIAIAGNIGSGKTSLTEIIAQRLGFKPYFEDDKNPYLVDFYEDMTNWSFNLQIYFLSKRLRSVKAIRAEKVNVVQDRTIYEDAYIFAHNLHQMGLMTTRDYSTYMDIFELAVEELPQPDLLIYLKGSVTTLISQIQRRGRAYEMSISEDYLSRLNLLYENWIKNVYKGKLLVIDVDKEDFVLVPENLNRIISQVESFM
jgi:deoxyadenosine/deoxycytidine kinase